MLSKKEVAERDAEAWAVIRERFPDLTNDKILAVLDTILSGPSPMWIGGCVGGATDPAQLELVRAAWAKARELVRNDARLGAIARKYLAIWANDCSFADAATGLRAYINEAVGETDYCLEYWRELADALDAEKMETSKCTP